MKLNYITFMVRDIERTVVFYHQLVGLKVVHRFNPGMGEIVFMANEADETQLEFIQFDNAEKVDAVGMTMSFQVGSDMEVLGERIYWKGNDTVVFCCCPK